LGIGCRGLMILGLAAPLALRNNGTFSGRAGFIIIDCCKYP
jgi:hypothetical protein